MKQFATATRRLRTIAIFIGSVLFPLSVRGQTIANPSPTELTAPLVFVPVLTDGGRIFAAGFSAAGNFVNAGDRIFLQAGATASFSFSVPSGQIRTVAYGIPTGGYVNTVPAEISVNGVAVATITEGLGGFGVTVPTRLILWRKSFGPGDYVWTIRSGGNAINVYGLWLSAPSRSSQEPQSPAPGKSETSSTAQSGAVKTLTVPSNHPWTDTGVDLRINDTVFVDATGNVSFSAEIPSVSPNGDQPACLVNPNPRVPYVAPELPCHSLIGRIGLSGPIFEVGSSGRFRATAAGRLYLGVNDNFFPDNSGNWTVRIALQATARFVATQPVPPTTGASIGRAAIRGGATSLELPLGRMYLYGMTTGGGAPSSAFTVGQYAQVENAAGRLSGALAYGTNNQNSYGTQTAYHDIGGVSIAGSWESFAAYSGSNSESGAHDASVSFEARENSLVVILGLASSQQFVSVEGIPDLHVDAYKTGGGIVIAHAYVKPGTYTVVEHSKVLAAGQDAPHMADLVGVFVFGGRETEKQPAVVSGQAHVASIRGVDFLNFDYSSDCWEQFDGFHKVIHISNGKWNKDDVGSFVIRKKDSAWMMTYGDLDGDGQDEAAIVTSCQGQTNFDYEEVFVFGSASAGPKLLARLSPSDWGKGEEGNGSYFPVTSVRVSERQLAVSFLAGGSHACPAWTVTARFQWNGSELARTGVDREPFNCQTQ